MSLAILDYGMGNLRSVQRGFEHGGHRARVITTPAEVAATDRLVVPGVGAFGDATAHLRETGLDDAIREHARKGRPLLGICLGLQLLFDVGEEGGEHTGLGILAGRCVRFELLGLKVPHMGWNTLDRVHDSPLLAGLGEGPSVYFVHSYHVVPGDPGVIATTTDYGGAFVSSVRAGNVVATQFHPEKSQAMGLKMLDNFARMG